MKYCNRCKVIIENNLDNCPLCKQKVINKNLNCEKDFPQYKKNNQDILDNIMRLFIFIFIVLIGTNIFLNIALSFKTIWAPYTIVILFYAYLMIRIALKTYHNIGAIVSINVFMLSIILFILDLFLGFTKWSFNYAIPFLILGGILSLVIFMLIKPIHFLDYLIYVIIITLFGLSLLIFLWLGLVSIKIPTIITAFISFLTIIGIFIFGEKPAKEELKKRFHY